MTLTILNNSSFEQLKRQHGEELIRNLGFRPELERDQFELKAKFNKIRVLIKDFQESGCKSAEECAKCGIFNCALREIELLLRD